MDVSENVYHHLCLIKPYEEVYVYLNALLHVPHPVMQTQKADAKYILRISWQAYNRDQVLSSFFMPSSLSSMPISL